MTLPEGRLVRSRVVAEPGAALSDALDRALTGYARLEPQDALLLDADASGVIAFRDGIPVAARHSGTGRGGPAALADLAVPGPYRVELRALGPAALDGLDDSEWRIPPGMAAERLAGDPDLADRTRRASPDHLRVGASGGKTGRDPPASGPGTGGPLDSAGATGTETGDGGAMASADAVAAFLDDEEKIEAIREQAREQARERAAEWGIEDQLHEE